MHCLGSVWPLVSIHQLLWRDLGNELLLLGNKMYLRSLLYVATHECAWSVSEWEPTTSHAVHGHRESIIVLSERIIMLGIILLMVLILWIHGVSRRSHVLVIHLPNVSLRLLANSASRMASRMAVGG